MLTVHTLVNDFTHLFFPHNCAGCGSDIIHHDSILCIRCLHELPVTNFHHFEGNPVEKHFWGRLPIIAAMAHCHFTKDSLVQQLLHQLKYKGNKNIGLFFGRLMGNALLESERFKDIQVLVPLPLYASREKKRGYNQATVICNGIAESMKIPVINNAVLRLSATETQTNKNRIERWQNMNGRFQINKASSISGKHILLVDDVITTGATLEACGHELLKAGDIRLSIATLAIASS